MAQSDLIPVTLRTKEEAREISRKGGLSRSPNKSIAAKLRWLKQKGLTDSDSKELYELMTDNNLSLLDRLIALKSLKSAYKKEDNLNGMAIIERMLLDWHEKRFGKAIKVEQTNTTVIDTKITFEMPKELRLLVEKNTPELKKLPVNELDHNSKENK
jgi:hypothetical protein